MADTEQAFRTPLEAERDAPISTLWTPRNGMVCYPATEAAQPLGNALARHVLALWGEQYALITLVADS